jgi:hypothetical protein
LRSCVRPRIPRLATFAWQRLLASALWADAHVDPSFTSSSSRPRCDHHELNTTPPHALLHVVFTFVFTVFFTFVREEKREGRVKEIVKGRVKEIVKGRVIYGMGEHVSRPARLNWWIVAPLAWAVPATFAVVQSLVTVAI